MMIALAAVRMLGYAPRYIFLWRPATVSTSADISLPVSVF